VIWGVKLNPFDSLRARMGVLNRGTLRQSDIRRSNQLLSRFGLLGCRNDWVVMLLSGEAMEAPKAFD
jgi:hypothetical protein